MKHIFTLITGVAVVALWPLVTHASEDSASALELMNQVHENYYYAGDGGQAKVLMTLTDKKGRNREREFWMFRTDIEDMGSQNYYMYFIRPADVRRTAILTLKHADKDDDRWLYIPAIDLVKRLSVSDSRSSFVGSDFTYEDVSGRLPSLDTHEFLPDEELEGKRVRVVKASPRDPGTADYSWRVVWIDPEYDLPVKEEYYDKSGEVLRRMTVDSIEVIENIPTVVKRTMVNLKSKHRTTIVFTEVSYKVELKASRYRERLLKSPPASLR